MCKTRVLSTKGETVVSACIGCNMYYLWHNNLLLNFTADGLETFRGVINSLPFHKNSLPFPDDTERIILHTPNEDVCFAFAYDEFELFKAAIDEAMFMNEVYVMMNK